MKIQVSWSLFGGCRQYSQDSFFLACCDGFHTSCHFILIDIGTEGGNSNKSVVNGKVGGFERKEECFVAM